MSPQTCTNCGSDLDTGQRFCPACGTPVAATPTEAVAAPPPKKTSRRGLWFLLVGGGGLVLLACICIAVFGGGALLMDTGVTPVANPRQDYEAGEYFIELIEQNNRGYWSRYPHETFSDFAAEVQVRFETDVESVEGGLVWRMQDGDNYYRFTISNTGQYVLKKEVDGEWQTLIPATASPHINTGIAANNLKVVASADLISIYVNDQHLADISDSSFGEGKVGLYASLNTDSPITTRVFFDNLLVYDSTAATKLYEDDFDDPESGWAAEETETYRVGYVSASESVAASGPVEVVSERELTPDEFFQAVEGDESFADVYDLAAEQGYTEPGVATEVILSNATVLSGLALGSPQDEVIIAIQAATDERSSSMLLRYENETLVLYDREGRAEITEQGVVVFDAAGDPIGETEFPESWRPPALASALETEQQPCITGPWHEIKTCLGGWLGTGGISAVCVGSLGTAKVTCPAMLTPLVEAATPACGAALLTATGSCAFGAGCVFYSGDDPPTLTPTMCEKAETPPTLDCWGLRGRELVVKLQDWECGVKVEDDRIKPPPDATFTIVCGGYEEVEVRDCGGNVATLNLVAPDCEVVETCSHSCEEGRCQEPVVPPRPTPLPPEPTGKPVIRIWLDGEEAELDEVLVLEDECVELKWEVQGATTVQLDGNTVSATGTRDLCPTEQWTTYNLTAEGPGGTNAIYWVVAK
jgi:hypothetical protein